jgi:uncharacterized protein (DUF58 family)
VFVRTNKSAWIRFLAAIGGLSLAFFAALWSTVAAESGNVWATAALASLSLLLAGLVGLVTVPYLARRVARDSKRMVLRRMRNAFAYDVTREGLVYLGLVIVIGVAGLNTGNNLLFVLVSAMLAAVVVSGLMSAAVLRPLELEIILPAHVFAGRSMLARLVLRNRRRFLPSLSVSVVPPRREKRGRRLRLERTTFRFPWWGPPEKQWLRLPDMAVRLRSEAPKAQPIFTGSAYFPYIPAGSAATAEVDLHFAHRGRYKQEGFGLATRFPFSFLLKTRPVELARELIVYPSVEPADSSLEVLPMITGEFESFVRGRGHDLYRIREYQPEDPRRHVDWKATARTGTLKVREYTREDERKLRVVFDNPAPGALGEEEYENAVHIAASLAWHFAHDSAELSFAAPGLSGDGIYDFLRYLALVQPTVQASVLDRLEVTDDYNLVVTARPRGSIPSTLWNCSYIVHIGESGHRGIGTSGHRVIG